jgi:hypothetical protein
MRSPLLPVLSVALSLANAAIAQSVPAKIQRFVAVDNVCAWPALTPMKDGSILATLHNRPSHGGMESDVECWRSANGEFWQLAGTPTKHEPKTTRMNHAVGLAKNGDVVVLCSGWTDVQQPNKPKQAAFRDAILRTIVCRSTDGARTWTRSEAFPAAAGPEWSEYVPFGPILAGADGALHAACYARGATKNSRRSWHFRSDDDGKTWKMTGVLGTDHNETAIFHLGGKRWLAAARRNAVHLFRSEDDGVTWQEAQQLTKDKELNATLFRLADGRILLSYGTRITGEFGVMAKLSSDEGVTWGEPIRLAHTLSSDCGYPSSVQRADGKIVTAYYAKGVENHNRYLMAAAIWEAPAK